MTFLPNIDVVSAGVKVWGEYLVLSRSYVVRFALVPGLVYIAAVTPPSLEGNS